MIEEQNAPVKGSNPIRLNSCNPEIPKYLLLPHKHPLGSEGMIRCCETERTLMIPVRELDRHYGTEMLQNGQVMKFVTYGKRSHRQASAEFSKWIEDWKQDNYGTFAVLMKAERGKFAGVLKLYKNERSRDLQLGYILLPEYCGQGLGTEIANAGKNYAFDRLKAPALDAFARVENEASQHILTKIGMRRVTDNFINEGRIYVHFRMESLAYTVAKNVNEVA